MPHRLHLHRSQPSNRNDEPYIRLIEEDAHWRDIGRRVWIRVDHVEMTRCMLCGQAIMHGFAPLDQPMPRLYCASHFTLWREDGSETRDSEG